MENQTALQILQSLANGIDPQSGKPFPSGSPYQHPDTVRALFFALRALETPAATAAVTPAAASKPRPSGAPENAGKPWSDEEDQLLASAFDTGKQIAELAIAHKRSRFAIEARLVKLGKITPPPDAPVNRRMHHSAAQPTSHYVL